MKVVFIGVGGVGGYFGGLLAKSGIDTTFVARGEQLRALRERGLSVRTVDGSFDLPKISVVPSVSLAGTPDVIFVSTKTYDRDSVARELASLTNGEPTVIPLQNGIDNDLRIKAIAPRLKVVPGLAYIISARTAPGVIEQTAGPRTIFFGERSGEDNLLLVELEALMRNAGIRATYSRHIEKDLWLKFAWLTTFAGMTALCRCPIGRIVRDEETFRLFLQCYGEVCAVAAAEGMSFSEAEQREAERRAEEYRLSGGHAKSSLLVDLEQRRPTEIESLNGAVVQLAQKHGIPVPTHETIWCAIRAAADEYLSQRA